jgi:Kef-type K+ transport system membrane component KefB
VWWRRKDPYVLAPIAAAHVVALGPALHWSGNGNGWFYLHPLVTGMVIGQVFLLGLWAALGGLRTLPRLGVVSLIFVCGLASYLIAARMNWVNALDSLLEGGLVGALAVGSYAAMLLPLRRLMGWRIDFDQRHYRGVPGRRGQVGLLDFAALSCAIAIPLTSIRLLDESSASSAASDWLGLVGVLTIAAIGAAPACYLALAWRRPVPTIAAVAAVVLLVSWGHSLAGSWINTVELFGGRQKLWGLDLETLIFHAGVATTCMTTFGVLRCFGLRLLVVPQTLPEESTSRVAMRPTSLTAA